MEKRLKRIELITIISLILIAGNLIYSVAIRTNNSNSNITEIKENKELPLDITREYSNRVISEIKNGYNLSDWKKLYNIFGEYAKAQIGPNQISSEFQKVKTVTGNINSYVYSHFAYEGKSEGAEWYEIYYKCRYDNGKGTIKISTRTVEDISEIVGFAINLDEL